MKRRVLCLSIILVVSFLILLSGRDLRAKIPMPSDVLTASEINELVNGQTVQVTIVRTKLQGWFYFNPNGEFKKLINNWLEEGHWLVNKRDRLCVSIVEGNWDCRILIRNMEDISQYVAKKDGNHLRELTYEDFIDGNILPQIADSSSAPLEMLRKNEIVMLFSDKTVESETVRKGRVSLTYYHPDGNLVLLRNGKKYSGTWRVTDKDRMCLKIENSKEKCRVIVKQGAAFSKYIVKKNGQHQRSINYRRFMLGKHF